ncbi:hypothetical protein WA026_014291 [Henosepilachna vigintioctopunctata]|uniref:Ribosomal protein mS38 C-terminal domain-containing protein n=1 Tax=Henosepilachna vigintioctopunctata TaxID=420089 RepID=A0AAW1TM63_9CUCU
MSLLFTKIMNSSIQRRGRETFNLLRKLSFTSTHPNTSPVVPYLAQQSNFIYENILQENNWVYQRNERIEMPIKQKIHIELPKSFIVNPLMEDPLLHEKIMDLPCHKGADQIEAARLIVIRRQKMKNHKLRKLRKKLKFFRAKIRQKRELKKEKEFQAVLIQRCKEAEIFSAEEYVNNRIQKYKEALAYVPKPKRTFYY